MSSDDEPSWEHWWREIRETASGVDEQQSVTGRTLGLRFDV